jgi:hypothetical protein
MFAHFKAVVPEAEPIASPPITCHSRSDGERRSGFAADSAACSVSRLALEFAPVPAPDPGCLP